MHSVTFPKPDVTMYNSVTVRRSLLGRKGNGWCLIRWTGRAGFLEKNNQKIRGRGVVDLDDASAASSSGQGTRRTEHYRLHNQT
jgi:hypothetical protein